MHHLTADGISILYKADSIQHCFLDNKKARMKHGAFWLYIGI